MRSKPTAAIPELTANPDAGVIVMKRKYKLLTPLYGGGAVAGVVDPETPIHGTTVRGQLRFWWRATRGGRFGGNLVAMRAEEDRLWGSTEAGSLVSIGVQSRPGREFKVRDNKGNPTDIGHPDSPYSYVAFPLRESKGRVYEGVTFELQLSFKPQRAAMASDENAIDDVEEVRAALWAWDTFGGVGARTRRGFGALHCVEVTPGWGSAPFESAKWRWAYDSDRVSEQLRGDVLEFVVDGRFPEQVPHLSREPRRYKLTNAHADAMRVWKHLIDELRDYRQNRPKGKYGRSHWPEPDAIRRITGQRLTKPDHTQPVHKPPIDKFPRAHFGLPILFGFHPKHKPDSWDEMNPDRDPRDTTLQGEAHDRLASPLILRPVACAGDRTVGLALILETPRVPPGGLVLTGEGLRAKVRLTLDPKVNEAERIGALHSWKEISNDVLQSFLKGLRKEIP